VAGRTPSQTIGPFFHEGLRWRDGGKVTFARRGNRVILKGRVIDGAGMPVADALVETWQLSPDGKPPAPARGKARPHGFGRVETGKDGGFRFETLMPGGAIPSLDVTIFMRGLLKPLRTRVYLAPEGSVRADPQLAAIADSPRLKTLVAARRGESEFTWDVRLQGKGETVFFSA
jgi:protocatechuate 3,4-dioxygenase alpha subunit